MIIPSSGESHLFAANVSRQEQLRGVDKVEFRIPGIPEAIAGLSPVSKVEPERGALYVLQMPSRRISPAPHLAKGFRMIFLSQIAKQLPWNDILNKKQGGWGVGLRVLL